MARNRKDQAMRDSQGRAYRGEDAVRKGRTSRRGLHVPSLAGHLGFGTDGNGLAWLFVAFVAALAIVAAFAGKKQLIDGPNLAERAEQHRTTPSTLHARRGTIYDRNGNILARSEECYDVYCNPKLVDDVDATAAVVAAHLGGSASDYVPLMQRDETFVWIERQADKATCEELRAELREKELTGVELLDQMRRVYPYGQVCGQVLGMVDVDGVAVSGLELYYDEVLRGTDGEMAQEVGKNGVPIADATMTISEPVDGKDLVLSIDVDVQKYAEQQVERAVAENEASSGTCVVCDPRNGEILAACSTPYADLTHPETLENEALSLKPVSNSYDPGSIFKVLTAAIGLESGTVTTNTYFTVPPTILVGKDIVHDDDWRGEYMQMNLREVLRRSSNVGAVLFAQEAIGAEAFAQGVEAFGIGSLTGVDFPGEAEGLVKRIGDYDPSTLGSMSFGQGLTIPMIQMVRATGAIANGGELVTPHFVTSVGGEATEWPEPKRAVSKSTAQKVTDMMRTVVENGTGWSAQVTGYDVAAKTGTGEQAEDGEYVQDKYLASVIGFAPASDPQVLVYVGLNETPYMSWTSAGPVFSAIMGEVLSDTGVLSTRGL